MQIGRHTLSRNDMCSCGSGLKFKKCCINTPMAALSDPPRLFKHPPRLPEISSEKDLQAYWDAYIDSLIVWDWERPRAIASFFRAIEVVDVSMLGFVGEIPHFWREIGNDGIHYAVMHAYRRCRDHGEYVPPPQISDTIVAEGAIHQITKLSRIRDHVEAVRLGVGSCHINPKTRIVKFFESEETELDLRRRQEAEFARQELTARISLQQRQDPNLIEIMDRVRYFASPERWTLAKGTDHPLVAASRELIAASQGGLVDPARMTLPDNLELGPYSVGDYKAVWCYLSAVGFATAVSWGNAVRAVEVPPIFSPPLMAASWRSLAEDLAPLDISEDRVLEVIRDLRYNSKLEWMPVADHPLIPLPHNNFLTLGRLLRHAGWEGRLLRALERLPWRKDARAVFNAHRESLMMDAIESALRERRVEVERRVRLGRKGRPAGDIDLLCWILGSKDALGLSLKWFYPPNYVSEVLGQAERIVRETAKHTKLCERWREFANQVTAGRSAIPAGLRLLPAIVVEPGPVKEIARATDTPVVTLAELLALLGDRAWSTIGELHFGLHSVMKSSPTWEMRYTWQRVKLAGEWKFFVPVAGEPGAQPLPHL